MALTKLTQNLIDGTIVTSVNGSSGAVTLETGTDWQATPKTADFTAVAGEGYFVDTTSTAITVTLPSSPTVGDEVSVIDYGANSSTNNITITSSDNIEGSSDDLVLSTNKVSQTLVYSDATKGWLVATDAGAPDPPLPPVEIHYLIAAGGGSGGNGMGGGGGAGGLTHNYGGTALEVTAATNYSLTVGAGGAGTTGNVIVNGSNSIFSTLTAIGGGGGSSLQLQRNVGIDSGAAGGSGGGSSSGDPTPKPNNGAGGAALQPTSASGGYGNRGGNNPGNTQGTYPGGGGGGSGGAGGDALTASQTPAGAGGVGLQVNIDGNNYYWAAGGGGNIYTTGVAGAGGLGGGGGGSAHTSPASAGAGGGSAINSGSSGSVGNSVSGGNAGNNTGSGGGGGSWVSGQGGNGGSGIVILRYPASKSITSGGSLASTTITISTDKVTTFTAGTGNIQFN